LQWYCGNVINFLIAVMTSKFHVTYGLSKKVLSCATNDLRDNINSAFSLENTEFIIQLWDNEFDDWCDVETMSSLDV